MSKTKSWLPIFLVLAVVFCFSFGAFAANGDITSPAGQVNQYIVSADIANGSVSTDTLYIGTVANYLGAAANGSTTVFLNGEALHPDDIIIMNNKVGIVLAVGTRNPWGYPAGSILDAGRVKGAVDDKDLKGNVTFDRDTVWSVEFLMNGWDSWSPNNCGVVSFELVNYDFVAKKEVTPSAGLPAVKVSRVFEEVGALTFDVITYYSIGADNEYAYIFDTVKSNNDVESPSLSNRFSITNKGDDGGAMADLGLLTGINTYGKTDRNIFATTLILPGTNIGYVNGSSVGNRSWSRNGGSVGYKELRANYAYAAQEFRVYDEYLFIDDQADTRAVIDFLNDYYSEETMNVNGTVYDAKGKETISNPVVIVKRDSNLYGWFIGEADGTLDFDLPKGEYTIYVERDGFAKGEPIVINHETSTGLSLKAGEALVKVTFNVHDGSDKPLWAKVEIEGLYPVVRFTGNSVFYAEDENSKGKVVAMVPSGEFTAKVFGEGYYFYSTPVIDTYNSKEKVYDVEIDMELAAPEGWISTDPHHHSNKNDAFALPEDVIRSYLAAGLDVAFTTDHDFTTNNYESYTYAQTYDMIGYVPSEEISASWAHFNVIPQTMESYQFFLDENQENNIMDQFAEFKVFVQQTHDAGATISANHPYYSYGLFYTNENSRVPGGYDNSFDNIEINACCSDEENIATINKATELWNAYLDSSDVSGEPVTKAHYLLASSDTHDVIYPGIANDKGASSVYHSGKGRTYVYLGDTAGMSIEEVGLATGQAIANGNSFASLGPILTPKEEEMFGEKYAVSKNDSWTFNTSIEVESLNGIETILLLSNLGDMTYEYNDQTVNNVLSIDDSYSGENKLTYEISESITTADDVWFAIMVIDASENEMFAISNPIWVNVTGKQKDIAGHWAEASIENLISISAIQGYEDGTFKPNNNITRAEFASILIKAFNLSSEQGTIFTDTANHWAKDSIATAAAHGILTGYSAEKFGPNDPITREQMAVMIVKAAKLANQEAGKAFSDSKTVSSWAVEAVDTVVGENIMGGYGDDTFKPQNKATRAEAATVIVKALGL